MPKDYNDRYFWTGDNVRLHYRDYPAAKDGAAVLLCLPGLTRNARDFAALAARFAPRFRVLAPSLRGRGESGYAADPLSYEPLGYLKDLRLLCADAGVAEAIVIGTSLGGLLGLLLGMADRPRIRALVLNDIGPDIGEQGLGRIQGGIGHGDNWPSWLIAARDIAHMQQAIYPDWRLEDWLRHAKRLCRIGSEGRIIWDYDPEIATPMKLPHGDEVAALDLWTAFDSLRDRPLLSIRGALSDILSAATQEKMAARHPGMAKVVIPRVGHAPTLDEEAAVAALEAFLQPFR